MVVERLWVEVNQRVNYPLQRAIGSMVGLDQDDVVHKWCTCAIVIETAALGLTRCVNDWNAHPIQGRI